VFGPLAAALVLAVSDHDYKLAFAALAVPATVMLSVLGVARLLYPRPQDLDTTSAPVTTEGQPRAFWIYLAGAALIAAGFADFPIMAFHFQRSGDVSTTLTAVFYAVAMAVSGTGSLLFGRLFDRVGIRNPDPVDRGRRGLCAAGLPRRLLERPCWRGAVGARDGRARVDHPRRGRADGLGEPTCQRVRPVHRGIRHRWMLGSIAIGALFSVSLGAVVAFVLVTQLAALPLIAAVRHARIP
jgi:MFS family permease